VKGRRAMLVLVSGSANARLKGIGSAVEKRLRVAQ
jgi:hypothetical protein